MPSYTAYVFFVVMESVFSMHKNYILLSYRFLSLKTFQDHNKNFVRMFWYSPGITDILKKVRPIGCAVLQLYEL